MRLYLKITFLFLIGFPLMLTAQKDIGTSPLGKKKSGLRRAFLLGNKYYEMGPLENTERDVDSVAATLEKLGFTVTAYKNKNLRDTQLEIDKFVSELSSDNTEIVVFYFSGHGLGYGETNYLLPVDTRLDCLDQLKLYGDMSLNRIAEKLLARGVKYNYFFIDACRNLPKRLLHCDGSPGISRGGMIKPLDNYNNAAISFATRPGDTADDNLVDQVNSLFTSELIKYLPTENLDMLQTFKLVKEGVIRRSGGKQSPQRWEDLLEEYTLVLNGKRPGQVLDPPKPAKVMSVIAYKPNSKQPDFEVIQLALNALKEKFPGYEVRQQTSSKGLSDQVILCTITRKTATKDSPVTVDGKDWKTIMAETELNFKFTQGNELKFESEVSNSGLDHEEKTAIRNSIQDSLKKLKDVAIELD